MAQALSTTPKHIVSVVGFQGSGKSTIGKELAQRYSVVSYEMSDIVKAIHTGLSRDELPKTAERTKNDPNWLSSVVYNLLASQGGRICVLMGVREPNIHKYLLDHGMELHSFEIKATPNLRYERLLELGKVHSVEQFLDHEVAEAKMGLRKVMRQARYAVETTEDTKPRDLALAMKRRLATKGVK